MPHVVSSFGVIICDDVKYEDDTINIEPVDAVKQAVAVKHIIDPLDMLKYDALSKCVSKSVEVMYVAVNFNVCKSIELLILEPVNLFIFPDINSK